jgi:hypothetical protein
MITWLLHAFGLDDGSGAWYLFWSGIVGDLALFGTLFVLLRRLNCHASGCWRIGIHHVVGTPFVTCRKHHPAVPTGKVSAEHIARVHQDVVDARTSGTPTVDPRSAQQSVAPHLD